MNDLGESPGKGPRVTWADWKRATRALSWRDLTEGFDNLIAYGIVFFAAYIFLWLFINLR